MSEPHPAKRHNPLQRGIRVQRYKEILEYANKSEKNSQITNYRLTKGWGHRREGQLLFIGVL